MKKTLITLALSATIVLIAHPLRAQKPKTGVKPPHAGGQGQNQTDPTVVKLEAAAVKAEKAAKAKPKDAKLKQQAAEAYYKAGYACEYSNLPPKPKYRGALRLYRKCLALNPNHA